MAVDVTFLPGTNTNNIDTNFQRVKDALEDVVSREGGLPNHMNADLDMNSNDLLNVGIIEAQDISLDGTDITGILTTATEAAETAVENAELAEKWATNPEDVPVVPGGYSAYHWAQKSEEFATGGVLPDNSVTTNKIVDNAVTFSKLDTNALATQGEAQAYTSQVNNKLMTPLRTAQAIAAHKDFVDVRELGCVAAPYADAVDCTAAIQAFITANPNGPHIRFPRTAAGTGFKVSHLELPAGTIVDGAGQEQSNIWHFGNESLFDVQGSYVAIRNLRIDAANTTIGASEIKLRTDLLGIERVAIEHISTYHSMLTFTDAWSYLGADPHLAVAVEIVNVKARYQRGPGFDMRDCWAYIRLRDCVVDFIGSASKNFAAYVMLNNAGSVWENCDTTGGTVDGSVPLNHGFVFQKSTAVWMRGCFADTLGGSGYLFIGECSGFYMSDCAGGLVGDIPLAIGGTGGACHNINLIDFNAYGRKGLPYAPASKAGIYAIGANDIKITGGGSTNNTGDGILLENCNHSIISNFSSRLNTGRGARTTGTGGAVLFHTGDYSDNTAGVLSFSGAAHNGKDLITTSGALGSLAGAGTL